MTTNRTIRRMYWRAAMTLLLCVLTTATTWAETVIATYMNADGTTGTHEATVINQNNMPTTLGADGTETWYVVTADVNYANQLDLYGDVNLIIADHKTMSVDTSIASDNDLFIYAHGNLTVYGQSLDANVAGTLSYSGSLRGIYVNNTYTQNSGNVSISSSYDSNSAYAFECGSMIVNGGSLTAEATGPYGTAIFCGNDITINGGIVTANGNYVGIGSANGNLTLDWTNATDRFTASCYIFGIGQTVSVAAGKALKDASGNVYVGTLTDDQLTALANQTLQPATQTEYIQAYLGAGNDGSAGKPYTINSIDGWNAFCLAIEDNATWNGFNGKTVVLGTSIGTAENPVTTMSGSVNNAFEGTFDGQGNTLTINIANTDNALWAAPFSNVSRATIQNLIVTGTITGTRGAGGIVGDSWNKSYITNCVSSVDISGGGYIGGFSNDGEVEITGCVFNGKIVGTNGGGFVGFAGHDDPLAIKDCLLDPKDGSSITGDGTFYHDDNCGVIPVNSYYTVAFGKPQGTAPRSVVAGDNVIVSAVSPVGNATATYNVSGITAYAKGITCGDTFYYGNGDDVNLTLSNNAETPVGYYYSSYTANYGTLSGNATDGWTLTMPDTDADVTISLGNLNSDGQPHDVTYMKPDGTIGTASAISLDGNEPANDVGQINLKQGTYFIGIDINYDNRNIYCPDMNGVLTFILGDGTTTNIHTNRGENYSALSTSGLIIHAQAEGTGTLNLGNAIITAYGGITINGGTVNVNDDSGSVIGSAAAVVLNGGTLTVTAQSRYGIGAQAVYLNGGTVSVSTIEPRYDCGVYIGAGLTYTDGTTISNNFGDLNDGLTLSPCMLADDDSTKPEGSKNADIIDRFNGKDLHAIALSGRTLYKDGNWNILCLPFDVTDNDDTDNESFSGTPLEGATVKALDNSAECNTGYDASTGILTLNFVSANAIEAGQAYIVKWTKPTDYDGHEGDYDISNPIFTGITMQNEKPANQGVISHDGYVKFTGTYSPTNIYTDKKTNLYIGSDNNLHCPWDVGMTSFNLNAFHAYFQLLKGLSADAVRTFYLNFGDEEIGVTSLSEREIVNRDIFTDTTGWYTLDGRRLSDKPTTKGMYIYNNKKVVIQ